MKQVFTSFERKKKKKKKENTTFRDLFLENNLQSIVHPRLTWILRLYLVTIING